MPNKSDRRKLAESIARSKGIKVKSAMRYIQRVEAPEGKERIKNPRFTGFSKYLKQKTQKQLTIPKTREEKRPKLPVYDERLPERPRRENYDYSGTRLMKLRGRVELGSSGSGDIRNRTVNATVSADLANRILNADSQAEAIDLFSKAAPYLADVIDFEFIEFGGDVYDDFDY